MDELFSPVVIVVVVLVVVVVVAVVAAIVWRVVARRRGARTKFDGDEPRRQAMGIGDTSYDTPDITIDREASTWRNDWRF